MNSISSILSSATFFSRILRAWHNVGPAQIVAPLVVVQRLGEQSKTAEGCQRNTYLHRRIFYFRPIPSHLIPPHPDLLSAYPCESYERSCSCQDASKRPRTSMEEREAAHIDIRVNLRKRLSYDAHPKGDHISIDSWFALAACYVGPQPPLRQVISLHLPQLPFTTFTHVTTTYLLRSSETGTGQIQVLSTMAKYISSVQYSTTSASTSTSPIFCLATHVMSDPTSKSPPDVGTSIQKSPPTHACMHAWSLFTIGSTWRDRGERKLM